MQTRNPIARLVTLLCAAIIASAFALNVHAQDSSYSASFDRAKEAVPINVLVGQSRVVNFDKPIGRFSVSNSDIAEAVLVAPDQVLVNGKAFGQVNFIAWEQTGGKFIVFECLRSRQPFFNRFAGARSLSQRRHPLEPGKRLCGHLRQRDGPADSDAGAERD
jgi:Flp pilus assembly secretin CpaC